MNLSFVYLKYILYRGVEIIVAPSQLPPLGPGGGPVWWCFSSVSVLSYGSRAVIILQARLVCDCFWTSCCHCFLFEMLSSTQNCCTLDSSQLLCPPDLLLGLRWLNWWLPSSYRCFSLDRAFWFHLWLCRNLGACVALSISFIPSLLFSQDLNLLKLCDPQSQLVDCKRKFLHDPNFVRITC